MPLLRITFNGKLRGALGISYRHVVTVEAADSDAARLKLYDTHEHISIGRIEALPPHASGVCPNCGQYQHATGGDCRNECRRRGFAPQVRS